MWRDYHIGFERMVYILSGKPDQSHSSPEEVFYKIIIEGHVFGHVAYHLKGTIADVQGEQEIQFLGIKWQDGRRQIPTEVINNITAMSPPNNKKETQALLGAVEFWRMHIPKYCLIVSPLYHVTQKKNDFKCGPEQQQAFVQIKREIVHAVALGPVWTGPDVKNVLYTQMGRTVLPGASDRKLPGRLKVDPSAFGVRDTEDLRPPGYSFS
ncbi:hypothetical protein AAES_38542 [Amazona aestiva]|uniref:Uncharacterized protein n=1 Tax=Amazona aestiva TaxID=12930 RepID=A0A0Q3MTF9_AMAAE|nr:hypothetical protein AAES_38542 [Amazona aestiva]